MVCHVLGQGRDESAEAATAVRYAVLTMNAAHHAPTSCLYFDVTPLTPADVVL